MIDPASLGALAALVEGAAVGMPVFEGEVLTGSVARRQVEPSGLVLVGGRLTGGRTGTFAFSSGRAGLNGAIQLPAEGIALVIEQSLSHGVPEVRLVEKPLAEVVCYPFPSFPDERSAAQDEADGQPGSGTTPVAVPLLSSRPGATAVLYLDFDGELVTDPNWNGGKSIEAKPAELTVAEITEIWRRVSEDYLSFNVDITTDVRRYEEAPVGRRMRCIVTPTNTAAPGAGGVAYLNSFAQAGTIFGDTIPCWVFNPGVIGVSEAVSHELGHTLGLRHDGRTSPYEEYYMGQGEGDLSWAPIMGVGYYRNVVQWSRGEYAFANNLEDDVAVIASPLNGFGFSADEAGNTTADAAPLSSDALGRLEGGGVVQSATDKDVYRFEAPAGLVRIEVKPGAHSPNVDLQVELRDAAGTLLAGQDAANSLAVSLHQDLATGGTYYLSVKGAGHGDAATDGYSNYGSMGEYFLRGSIPVGDGKPFLESGTSVTLARSLAANHQLFAANSPTSFVATGLPAGLTLDAATGTITGIPTAPAGSYTITITMTNAVGTSTGTFVLTLTPEPTPTVTMPAVMLGWQDRTFSLAVSANALPQSYAASGLPAGLAIDPATGLISGVPTAVGVFPLTVSATNAAGTGSAEFSLAVVRTGSPLAVGSRHSLFVQHDGTLWAVGANETGQLGDGTEATKTTPIPVMTGVAAVAAGYSHSLILKDDHTLWAVGANDRGQLGDGSGQHRNTPVVVATEVVAVAAGDVHSLWLKSDGTVWATGENYNGQLGNGTTQSELSPVLVATGATAIAAYGYSSFFVRSDGTLWAMGQNASGHLGDGTEMDRLQPVHVADGVFLVAASSNNTLFVKSDGTLWGMGANNASQLVAANTGNQTTPIKIAEGVIGAASAQQGSYALKFDHTLTMRGWDGTTYHPAFVTVASAVDGVTCNSDSVFFSSLDGRFWGMGRNTSGQFGDGSVLRRDRPVMIAADVAAAAGGRNHTLFTKVDGSLWTCGGNSTWQLGNGTIGSRGTPSKVADEIRQAAAGAYVSFYVGTDGKLSFVGLRPGGPGTTESEPQLLDGSVRMVAAGGGYALYLKEDDSLWAVGDNERGQLGDGTTANRLAGVEIAAAVAAIAAGEQHAFFVKSDGTLWAMGGNAMGQLGDGSTTDRTSPVLVASGVSQAAASNFHSLFLKSDGTLWGMGNNRSGQLGDGTLTNRITPIQLAGNVASFACSQEASFFVQNDGTLWATGQDFGPTPVRIARGVARVYAGVDHALIVKLDGTLWTLGDNTEGQLGDGRTVDFNTPVEIKLGPPAITAVDLPFEVDLSGSVTFSVSAVGVGPLEYQWRRNGVAISGATGATYTVSNAQAQDGATYDVQVTGPGGSVISASGPLFVVGAKPWFTSPGQFSAPRLIPLTFRVTVANEASSFAAQGLPAGLAINPASGLISGTPEAAAGIYTVDLSATNASGTSSAVLTLTLSGEPVPTITSGATVVGRRGLALSYAIAAVPAPESFAVDGLPAGLTFDPGTGLIAGTPTGEAGLYPVTISGTNSAGTGTKVIRIAILSEWQDRIAASQSVSFWVDDNGGLWGAGYNVFGQLGDGTQLNRGTAMPVADNVVSVASSQYDTYFIKRDGSLWGMGCNQVGELGLGNTVMRLNPTRIARDVVGAAVGNSHGLFLKADGGLWAVGGNAYGQLGDGSRINRLQPVLVASGVRAVAGNGWHSLFIKLDDTLWGMGYNGYGALGDGTTEDRLMPVPIAADVKSVSASWSSSLFLKNDGSLWGMGLNGANQLKTRTAEDDFLQRTPVKIADGVVGMAAGANQHLYLFADGSLWGRGSNIWAQQGDQAHQYATESRQLATGVVAFSTGQYHSLFRRSDGTISAWGISSAGEVADGFDTEQLIPQKVAGNVRQVAAGADQSLFITAADELWGMGYNGLGGLGDGTNIDRIAPVRIAQDVREVSSGYWHTMVVKNDDSLWVAGNNGDGQLGLGTFNLNGIKDPRLLDRNVLSASAGMWHSLYLKKDGTVWGAGWNGDGQLGDGTNVQKTLPVQVMANVAHISAGGRHSMFLKEDGTLWTSGLNQYGQLGDGTTVSRITPVQVATGVAQIAAGGGHSLFLKSDGTLWGMGLDGAGQLGYGGTANIRPTPVLIDTGVRAIAAGVDFSQYVKEDGTLWVTGLNTAGSLGDGNTASPFGAPPSAGRFTTPNGAVSRLVPSTGSQSLAGPVAADAALLSIQMTHAASGAPGGSIRSYGGQQLAYLEGPLQTAGKPPQIQFRPVKIATGVAASSAGLAHSFYIRQDGSLWATGSSYTGRLGNGAGTTRWEASPVQLGRPAIRTQSIPFAAALGERTNLAVDAVGAGTLTYQWRKNGEPIPGATLSRYLLPAVAAADGGIYDVVVTNAIASVACTAVNLSVMDATPAFPDNLTFSLSRLGDGFSFRLIANNDAVSYGATGLPAGLSLDPRTGVVWGQTNVPAGVYQATVLATNGNGTTTAQLTVIVTEQAIPQLRNDSATVVRRGQQARYAIQADSLPESFSAAGLPAGLILDVGTGIISGRVQAAPGRYVATLAATNASGTASAEMTFFVLPASAGLAAGRDHSMVVDSEGVLWAMGDNVRGQLGDGTVILRPAPVRIATDVVAASVSEYHSLFLKADGTLWGAGLGQNGQLGTGGTQNYPSPKFIASHVRQISAGGFSSLFVDWNDEAWATGQNQRGQLGDGTRVDRLEPVQIGTGVEAVAGGGMHSLILLKDGTLRATGSNEEGQLGDGTRVDRSVPVTVATGVTAISAGYDHSLFLKNDGTMWACGGGALGQLGNAEFASQPSPVPIASGVATICAGTGASSFLDTAGGLWVMGQNGYGALLEAGGATPVKIRDGVAAMALGVNHSLILDSSGDVYSAGYAASGQLGDAAVLRRSMPMKITSDVSRVAPGSFHTMLVTDNGDLWSAGIFYNGERGSGISSLKLSPVEGITAREVAAQSNYTLYVDADRVLWGMGYNLYGEIGGAAIGPVSPAHEVATDVVAVTAGSHHSFYITADGSLWASGRNDDGRLGDGTAVTRPQPVKVADQVAKVVTGEAHTLFLKVDGTLWGVGRNDEGELGTGNGNPSLVPILVATDVSTMAAGDYHSLFVKTDGTLWAMGRNDLGELGDPMPTSRYAPIPVDVGVAAVSAAEGHSVYLKTDGTLWSMGLNSDGQLGDGTEIERRSPTLVATGVESVTAGRYRTFFRKRDHSLWGMGTNSYGCLGIDVALSRREPFRVVLGAPVIESLLVPMGANLGGTALLTVKAAGVGPFSYQWRKQGVPITGATGEGYFIGSVAAASGGSYDVVVTGSRGSTISPAGTLAVLNASPVIDSPLEAVMDSPSATYRITANNDAFLFSATGLPVGLAVDPATGLISGATTAPSGHHAVTITASNSHGTGQALLDLEIRKLSQPAPAISSPNAFTVGSPYIATVAVTGFGAVEWALGAGSTAAGAAVDPATGAVAAMGPGTVVIKVRFAGDIAYDPSAYSSDFAITVNKQGQAAPVISSASSFSFGNAYTATASSGFGSREWTLGTGSTATGAAIDAATGAVTSTGAGTVVIKVRYAGDAMHEASPYTDFTVTVLKLSQLAPAIASGNSVAFGAAYTATASSGFGAREWALGAGSTAAGAAIDAGTGAVTSTGVGTVVIKVRFAGDATHLASDYASDFTITVNKASQAAPVISSAASFVFGTSYTATANSGYGAVEWVLAGNATGLPAGIDGTTGVVTVNAAGWIGVAARFAGDANHQPSAYSTAFQVTIDKATQGIPVITSANSFPFGAGHVATATAGYGPWEWSLGAGSSAPGAAIDAVTGALSATGIGTVVVKVRFAGDTSYLPSAYTNDFPITFVKLTQAEPVITSAASYVFGNAYTATAGPGFGALEWALAGGSTAAGAAISPASGAVTATGVGTVVIKARFAGDATHEPSNYSPDFTVTVGKASQAAPLISSATAFVFGTAYTAQASTGFGPREWALGTGSTAAGAAVDAASGAVTASGAGTVVIKVRFAGDATHLASDYAADFSISIAPAAQAAPVVTSPNTLLFGSGYTATTNAGFGVAQWVLGTGSTATGAAITVSGLVTAASEGTVVIKARFGGDAGHEPSPYSGDFTITVAKLSQPPPVISSGSSFAFGSNYTATANAGFGPLQWSLGAGSTALDVAIDAASGAVTSSGPGSVVIRARFAGDALHQASDFSAPFTITVTVDPLLVPPRPALFDAEAYLAANPDVAAGIGHGPDRAQQAWDHYWRYGITEGRTDGDFNVQAYMAQYPGAGSDVRAAALYWYTVGRKNGDRIPAGFSVAGYFLRNSDIAAIFANDKYGAWLHYYNYGVFEGRSYDANFIVDEYLELNPDLKSSFGTNKQEALMHWLTWGHPVEDRMGRVPIGFNVDSYLARYPDLEAVFGDITPKAVRNVTVWHHYVAYGTLEGRTDGDFEAYNYLATNPDLAAVFGSDIRAAALHWFFYGRREGRRIPGGFDVADYRMRYPDIVVGLGDDLYGSWLHYRDTGVNEGRVFGELFRPADYLALNPDVAAVIGNSYRDALLHWLFYGQFEGRPGRF